MQNIKVGIQGYEGSFHHIAAESYYKGSIQLIPEKTFHNLISALNTGESDEAVMAIENSIAGSILNNYNLLTHSDIFITGEIYLQVKQNLLALPEATLEDIDEVHSHPMALLQCENFFSSYPHIKLVEAEDTALSARRVHEIKKKNIAAIASSTAAKLYGLQILEEGIETDKNNYTRFLILSRKQCDISNPENNKASLHFTLPNVAGSLSKALAIISQNKLNISKIQSTPVIGLEWQYYFHLDINFDNTERLLGMLDELKNITQRLKILGIYRKGTTV